MTLELAPWVQRTKKRAENDRALLDGVDTVEDFGWLHLPCGDAVVEQEYTISSAKVDLATADPKPILMFRKHCNIHNVSSIGEEIKGE
jgi:hypothetical protein